MRYPSIASSFSETTAASAARSGVGPRCERRAAVYQAAQGVSNRAAFPRRGGLSLSRVHRAASLAGAQRRVRVELLEERRQVGHDRPELDLDPVEGAVAFLAIPLEPVLDPLGPLTFDHEAQAARLRPLGRVADVRRQQEHRAFLERNFAALAVLDDPEEGIAPELPEELLVRIVVVVGPPVRTADDGHDEVSVLPDLLVADWRLEEVLVLLQPLREVERCEHGSLSGELRAEHTARACRRATPGLRWRRCRHGGGTDDLPEGSSVRAPRNARPGVRGRLRAAHPRARARATRGNRRVPPRRRPGPYARLLQGRSR